jgi:hypothetical protein
VNLCLTFPVVPVVRAIRLGKSLLSQMEQPMNAMKMAGWVVALAAGTLFVGNASAFGNRNKGCDTTPACAPAPATKLVTVTEYKKVPVEKMVTVREVKSVPVKETREITTYSTKKVTEQVPVTKCVDKGHFECREVVVGQRSHRVPVTTQDACGNCVTRCERVCEPVVRTQKVWVPNVVKESGTATVTRCVKVPEKKTVEVTTCKKVVTEKQVKVCAYECVPVTVTKEVCCDNGCDSGRRRLCR